MFDSLEKARTWWLQNDPNPETRAQLEALPLDSAELHRMLLGPRIVFGTAGLRAKMEPGFQGLNDIVVTQTAQGLAKTLLARVPDVRSRGVIVGYDHRHRSRRFAEITVNVLLSQGIKCYLFERLCATPYVAYGVRLLGCGAGVMVTPSHNPAGDNGYKLYWGNGAQIIHPISAYVQADIEANLEIWEEGKKDSFMEAEGCYDRVENAYLGDTLKHCCWTREKNGSTPLRVVFTPMHGVGKDMTARILKEWGLPAYIPVPEQIEPHPDFPTVKFPNPEEKGALDLAMKTADAHGLDLVFAEDPDSDRFACAEKNNATGQWYVFTGNEIALLLAHWALMHVPAERRKDGFMLASTVSSKVLSAIAKHPEDGGFVFEETLTGFKWMGNRTADLNAQGKFLIFAFEVEIGFLVGDMSLDKDGIRALACFYELAASLRASGKTCREHLNYLYARYGYFTMINSYFRALDTESIPAVFHRLRHSSDMIQQTAGSDHAFEGTGYATTIAGSKVVSVRDLTTGYDSSQPNHKAILFVDPSAHMITYTLEDGTVLTLRTSGTEPKLKYYIETFSKESDESARRRMKEIEQAVIHELVKPKEHRFAD